jgi:hypothetical protein
MMLVFVDRAGMWYIFCTFHELAGSDGCPWCNKVKNANQDVNTFCQEYVCWKCSCWEVLLRNHKCFCLSVISVFHELVLLTTIGYDLCAASVLSFSQKTWSTGISAGKHETLLISHGCEWNVEESIKLVGWHWNLNWRLQLNCKWIIAELQKKNFILTLFFECEICSTHCAQDIQDNIVITNELWHSRISLSLDELLLFLSKLDSLLVT